MDRQTYLWFDYLDRRIGVLDRKLDAVLRGQQNPDPQKMAELARAIEAGTAKAEALKAALAEAPEQPQSFFKESDMPTNVQQIDDMVAAVAAENEVIDGAIVYVKSVPGLIQAGIDAALAAGATAAQLSVLTASKDELVAKRQALVDALTANTPAPATATARQHKP